MFHPMHTWHPCAREWAMRTCIGKGKGGVRVGVSIHVQENEQCVPASVRVRVR
jgi:hypothetical protein